MDRLQNSLELNLSLKKNEKIALGKLKETLSQKFNLVDFRLFGSKVRGESTPESDIDVMIEVEKITHGIESQIDDIVFKINLEKDTFMPNSYFVTACRRSTRSSLSSRRSTRLRDLMRES